MNQKLPEFLMPIQKGLEGSLFHALFLLLTFVPAPKTRCTVANAMCNGRKGGVFSVLQFPPLTSKQIPKF